MNVYGELTRASLENLSADPASSARTAGRMWWRTDTSKAMMDTGSVLTQFWQSGIAGPAGTAALPSLAIGNVGTGFFKSNNATGSIVNTSLDGVLVDLVLWNRLPLTNTTRTPTGDTTNGSAVITNLSSMTGITIGMTVRGLGIPSSVFGERNLVVAIAGNTVTMRGTPDGLVTSSHVGATYTFEDPGNAQFVFGTENLPMGLSMAGNNFTFNSSDWAAPADNYIICGNGATDSLTVTGDDQPDGLHGASIRLNSRSCYSDPTAPSKTYFYNSGRTSGTINTLAAWTLGEASGAQVQTLNGILLVNYTGTQVLKTSNDTSLYIGTPATATGAIRLYGCELQFNESAVANQVNVVYSGGGSTTDQVSMAGGYVAPGGAAQSGSGVSFYGHAHATKANLIEFYQGTSLVLKIDASSIINFMVSGNESTGAGTALLSTNCPAVTATAPYKWLKTKLSDGSVVYIPCWK